MSSARVAQVQVKMDDLDKAINDVLQQYGDFAIDVVTETVAEMSKEIPKRLKIASPRKKGKYAKGWKAKIVTTRTGTSLIVFNGTKPQLTHLLENGHAKKGGGRVDAKPHIAPVNDWAQKETIERIEKRLSE